ncbi:hypothetical protein NC652_007175 [Populus alba x Populus x berolinensis]|nr:hypothetical protein NC652_007175 [Populus alba x Populus x berolinensis]
MNVVTLTWKRHQGSWMRVVKRNVWILNLGCFWNFCRSRSRSRSPVSSVNIDVPQHQKRSSKSPKKPSVSRSPSRSRSRSKSLSRGDKLEKAYTALTNNLAIIEGEILKLQEKASLVKEELEGNGDSYVAITNDSIPLFAFFLKDLFTLLTLIESI